MSPWYVPRRIQRQRTKGYRLPLNAVYVGRPSRYGNIVKVGECSACAYDAWHDGAHIPWTAAQAVALFRDYARSQPRRDFAPLRGRDLACWCALCPEHRGGLYLGTTCPECAPCHADVLLELANR